MNAIDELITEHEAVKTTLRVLDNISHRISTSATISQIEHIEQLFEFFTVFVDKCHHGKEEELLFPAMEAVGISREGGPIGVMLSEHQQGRDLVSKMKQDLGAYVNGDGNAAQAFKMHADAYVDLLNYHIDKENEVLFPMAMKHLSAHRLAEMKSGFDRIETERIGQGKHEAFHRMLEDLKSAYLTDSK